MPGIQHARNKLEVTVFGLQRDLKINELTLKIQYKNVAYLASPELLEVSTGTRRLTGAE